MGCACVHTNKKEMLCVILRQGAMSVTSLLSTSAHQRDTFLLCVCVCVCVCSCVRLCVLLPFVSRRRNGCAGCFLCELLTYSTFRSHSRNPRLGFRLASYRCHTHSLSIRVILFKRNYMNTMCRQLRETKTLR